MLTCPEEKGKVKPRRRIISPSEHFWQVARALNGLILSPSLPLLKGHHDQNLHRSVQTHPKNRKGQSNSVLAIPADHHSPDVSCPVLRHGLGGGEYNLGILERKEKI